MILVTANTKKILKNMIVIKKPQHYRTRFCYQLTLPVPIPDEERNFNFYFRLSLWCLKRFYEDLEGLHKTFWGTTKKCDYKIFKLIFILIKLSEMHGAGLK